MTAPTGPTEIVYPRPRVSGPDQEGRRCFPTRERAEHFAQTWPLPDGWHYEPCQHLPEES
jgi:hypothetical protein